MGTSQFTKRRDAVGVANDVAHSQWRTTNWIPLGLSQSAVLGTGQLRDALSGADVRLRDGQHVDTCCVGAPGQALVDGWQAAPQPVPSHRQPALWLTATCQVKSSCARAASGPRANGGIDPSGLIHDDACSGCNDASVGNVSGNRRGERVRHIRRVRSLRPVIAACRSQVAVTVFGGSELFGFTPAVFREKSVSGPADAVFPGPVLNYETLIGRFGGVHCRPFDEVFPQVGERLPDRQPGQFGHPVRTGAIAGSDDDYIEIVDVVIGGPAGSPTRPELTCR